jgi:hypothetical protein
MPDPAMEREMHDLRAKLEDMEIAQRRIVSAGDLSDSERENEVEHEGEEVTVEYVANKMFLRVCCNNGCKSQNGHSSL